MEARYFFTPAIPMGCQLCVICNTNSFHSFYTNLAYIQISSNSLAGVGGVAGVWGQGGWVGVGRGEGGQLIWESNKITINIINKSQEVR